MSEFADLGRSTGQIIRMGEGGQRLADHLLDLPAKEPGRRGIDRGDDPLEIADEHQIL